MITKCLVLKYEGQLYTVRWSYMLVPKAVPSGLDFCVLA